MKAQKLGMGEPCGASLPPNPAESEDRGQDEPHRVLAKDTDQCQLLPAGLGRDSCPLPGCPKAPPPQLRDPSRVFRDQQDPRMGANF